MLTIGPAIVALLDVLQFRHGVSIEIVDASFRPAQGAGTSDFGGVLANGVWPHSGPAKGESNAGFQLLWVSIHSALSGK